MTWTYRLASSPILHADHTYYWSNNISFSVVKVRKTPSGADSIGRGGTWPSLLQMARHGRTESRRTANKKLTKLYWPSRKRPPKRRIVPYSQKVEERDQKNPTGASPALKFVPAPLDTPFLRPTNWLQAFLDATEPQLHANAHFTVLWWSWSSHNNRDVTDDEKRRLRI